MKETFIQNAPLFSTLSPGELNLIGDAMKPQSFAKGETLLTQGQPIQKMYLIQSGWVKQTTTLDGGRTIINNLGPGSLVGEMDVLLDQPASSTAQTNSDVNLWSLAETDLNKFLNDHPLIGLKFSTALGSRVKPVDRYLVQHRLRQMPLFVDLERTELTAIAEKLEPLEIRRGGLIFRVGAPGETLFIIEAGEVIFTSTNEVAGEPFRQLGPGDVLGEMAVLTNKPYDGVARASNEVMLWVLQRSDFLALTTRYPNIRVAMSARLSQPLSTDDRVLAQEHLKHLTLFKDIPEPTLNAAASVLVLRHYPKGEQIFSAGDPGDSLIIVDNGAVQLLGDDQRTSTLRPGDHDGEMSLLTGKSRTQSASAATDCNLWVLYKSDFDELLARHPALGDALSRAISAQLANSDRIFLNQHLRAISLFAGLSDDELRDVAEALHAVRLNRGELAFSEGQRGDAVYFIETGEVQIATRVGESYQMNFERLIAGDFFGEIALLTEGPRKSTARAVVNDTQLWVLNKADFDRILVKYPQLALSLSKVLGERLARTDSRAARDPARRPQIKPPSSGYLASATRPAVARPSPIAAVKRPTAPGARPSSLTRATPLTFKPPTIPGSQSNTTKPRVGMPQARPVAARPQPSVLQSRPIAPRPRVAGAPQTTAVAIRPAPRPPALVRQPTADPLTLAVMGSVTWMLDRSIGFKFRMVALTMLFVWLCGIAGPVAVLTALTSPQVGEQLAAVGVAVNINEDGVPLPIPLALLATFTPTPPPTKAPPKSAPVQASPTTVPVVSVAPPTAPSRVAVARPSPQPTATTAQPVIVAAAVPQPSVDFKLIRVRQLTPCENNGNHNVYVLVLDAQGNGMPNVPVEINWGGGVDIVRTGQKRESIPYLGVDAKTTAGYLDWANFKGAPRVKVAMGASEQTEGLRVDLPDQACAKNGNSIGNSTFHYSYLVVFQKTR